MCSLSVCLARRDAVKERALGVVGCRPRTLTPATQRRVEATVRGVAEPWMSLPPALGGRSAL